MTETISRRTLSTQDVARCLVPHLPVYRYRRPAYQTVMLNALLRLWRGPHKTMLDIGGGTGVIGQCVQDLFEVGSLTSVDVVDRYCPGLTIDRRTFDGERLPFADACFDAGMLNNVVHHVPVHQRIALFAEIGRVVEGPLYVKDHVAAGSGDRFKLWLLDFIGNVPFGGMVEADYLSHDQWEALAAASGFRIAETTSGRYRSAPMNWLFPNSLEITMRWERC